MKIFIFRGMTSCPVSTECHVNSKLRLLAKIICVVSGIDCFKPLLDISKYNCFVFVFFLQQTTVINLHQMKKAH